MRLLLAALLSWAPPGEWEPGKGVGPGGYWELGERPEPEPPDGREKLIAAYILMPLGVLAVANGAAFTYLMSPQRCPDEIGSLGRDLDEGECRGLFIYSAIRTAYGSLMLGSGIALLGIGLHQRKRHRAWKARHLALTPEIHGRGGGLTMTLRF